MEVIPPFAGTDGESPCVWLAIFRVKTRMLNVTEEDTKKLFFLSVAGDAQTWATKSLKNRDRMSSAELTKAFEAHYYPLYDDVCLLKICNPTEVRTEDEFQRLVTDMVHLRNRDVISYRGISTLFAAKMPADVRPVVASALRTCQDWNEFVDWVDQLLDPLFPETAAPVAQDTSHCEIHGHSNHITSDCYTIRRIRAQVENGRRRRKLSQFS